MFDTSRVLYSYNDVAVKPAKISEICHRSECNPFTEDGHLPIFTAPMDTVVNEKNYDIFDNNKIIPIIPRNLSLETRINYAINGKWAAFSLGEFVEEFTEEAKYDGGIKALIDIANGHMTCLYEAVREAKKIYGNGITIMVGNIANPNTYEDVWKSGADFVRISVGTGAGCITSSNTAIHYPMASLIDDMKMVKEHIKKEYGLTEEKMPKIIADGGIRNYSDVIKALALGADYVMVGGLFAAFLESASPIINSEFFKGYELEEAKFYDNKIVIGNTTIHEPALKNFYGMASKRGQLSINGEVTKTAEGVEKTVTVKYKISDWVKNMEHYLRSAMSYTNSSTLEDLKNNTTAIVVSEGTKNSVNK